MGISRELAPGWNRGHEAGARHQSFSARARQIELLPSREGASTLASHLRRSIQNLSERNLREIDNLSREKNPELALAGFLAFGRRLEEEGRATAAAEIYAAVGAKDRFDALQGRGHPGLRAEVLLKNFSAAASDYRTIVPMIAGSAVYQIARASALSRLAASTRLSWFTRGAGARNLAGFIGLGAEIPCFAFANRALSGSAAGIGEDLGRAALTLGVLKFSGGMGNKIPVPQAATTFLGLMAAHRLEEHVGLRSPVDGATTMSDTLAAMVSLSVGAHLGNRILGGGFARFQRELEARVKVPPEPSSWNSNRPKFFGIPALAGNLTQTITSRNPVRDHLNSPLVLMSSKPRDKTRGVEESGIFPLSEVPLEPVSPPPKNGTTLPPDFLRKLPRGGIMVKTSQGWVQFGVPPWTNKDALEIYLSQKGFELSKDQLPHLIPTTYLFDLDYVSESHGLLPADFIQYMYFAARRTTFQMVAPDPAVAERLKAFLDLSYFGPEDAEALSARVRKEYLLGARGIPDLGREIGEGFRDSPHPEALRHVAHLDEAGVFTQGGMSVKKLAPLLYEITDQGVVLGRVDLKDHPEPKPVFERSLSLASDFLAQGIRRKVLVEGRPGIWPIGTGHGFTTKEETSGFMIWNQGKVTLLDPPSTTLEYLLAHGIPLSAVEGVIITHGHTDHHGPAVPKLLRALPKINVYATLTVRDMLQRQYDLAIGNQGEGLVQWNFLPVYPQNFKKINGLHMIFDYSFHSVPAMMLRVYDRPDAKKGKLMWFLSGDTLLDEQEIWSRTLKGPGGEAPVMSKARAKVALSPLSLLLSSKGQKPAPHMALDAGVRPIHAGPDKIQEALEEAAEHGVDVSRVQAYHVAQEAADMAGLSKLQAGPKGFIDFSEFFPHLEPSGWEVYVLRVLEQTPLLRSLPEATKRRLIAQGLQSVDAGTTLIREGEREEDIYILIDGEVEIWRGEKKLALRPNGILGEGALFGEARNATVMTTVASLFLKINGSKMMEIVSGEPLVEELNHIRQVRAEAHEAVLASSLGGLPDSILDALYASSMVLSQTEPAPAKSSGGVMLPLDGGKALLIQEDRLKQLMEDYPGIGIALKRAGMVPL